jgi:4'-phosphopantetheinyl transferase
MGVVFIKKVSEHAQLGLWKIEESAEDLVAQLNLSGSDQEMLHSKKNILRKKEWLASRNLLKAMFPKNKGIRYDTNGKPFLNETSNHISISHSGDYACVYLNQQNPVGVDIQKLKPDISKGADFFLSAAELDQFGTSDNLLLHILWSAKEAVYKFFAAADIDVKKDIYLLPFQRNQSGTIEVNISYSDQDVNLHLHYQTFDDYVLTRTN